MSVVRCTNRVGNARVITSMRRRLGRAARVVAEQWYAWRASHELLSLYLRIRAEEPQLTTGSLYQEVIARRLGLNIEAASAVLLRARRSFCEWPSPRRLRYRDVVHYVVVDAYIRSHSTDFGGTYTDMRRVVVRIIPYHL